MRFREYYQAQECYKEEQEAWDWYWSEDATYTTTETRKLIAKACEQFGVLPVSDVRFSYGSRIIGGGWYEYRTARILLRIAQRARFSRDARGKVQRGRPRVFISNALHECAHHICAELGFHDGHGPNFRAFLELVMNWYAPMIGKSTSTMRSANRSLVEKYARQTIYFYECKCGWQVRSDQKLQHVCRKG